MQWAHNTGYGTRSSKNMMEASAKARGLYRDCLRAIPYIKKAYVVDIPPSRIRDKFRVEFEKHAGVDDTGVVDHLTFLGKSELLDTINMYKTRSHVMKFLLDEKPETDVQIAAQDDLELYFEHRNTAMDEDMKRFLRETKKGGLVIP